MQKNKEIKIKLYGCQSCGSELTEKEMKKAKLDNKEGFTCRFCENTETLEYLGQFKKSEIKY